VSNGDIIKNRFNIDPDRVRVVIDGVHTDFFSKTPQEGFKQKLGIPEDAPVIIFTGALLAAKGIWNLISSIPLVLKKVGGAHFLIVGYPVEEASKKVKELGVEKNVHFTGMVDYFKLPDYLLVSDVAVEPKVDKAGEASGKVINYMGAGLPVVCFEGKNNRRFLGEDGIYAADDRVENLAEKMIWAVKNSKEAEKLGKLNKKRVEKVFSWNNSIRDTVEAFERLISKRKAD